MNSLESGQRVHERWMRYALEQAHVGERTAGAGAVGCVIVRDGVLVASGHNEAEIRLDPTAHAEIVTIRRAAARLRSTDLRGCSLYCTLQPCGMCIAACVWAKITSVIFGASRSDVHRMYFDAKHINATDLVRDAYREDLQIVGGVLAADCADLYYAPGDHPPAEEQVNI